jgi:hypothetical protein
VQSLYGALHFKHGHLHWQAVRAQQALAIPQGLLGSVLPREHTVHVNQRRPHQQIIMGPMQIRATQLLFIISQIEMLAVHSQSMMLHSQMPVPDVQTMMLHELQGTRH